MFGRKKKNREMAAEMPQMTERPRVVRTVPELATLSYTDQGRREYQQDAVYVTPSKKFAANRKTRGRYGRWRKSKPNRHTDDDKWISKCAEPATDEHPRIFSKCDRDDR